MITCDDCTVICTYCIHSRDATDEEYNKNEYDQIQWCEKHNKGINPCDDGCDDFICLLTVE